MAFVFNKASECKDAVSAGGDTAVSDCPRGLPEISSFVLCRKHNKPACDLHEYFNVNTSFVLPVQVRGECRQNWLTFSSLCPASADLDLAMSALNVNLG